METAGAPTEATAKPRRPWVRPLVDFAGPVAFVVVFFASHKDMMAGTWALVAVSALALVFGFVLEKRIAPMPLLAGGAALFFGLLALVFHDPRFVKIKPTAINLLLGTTLLTGYFLGKSPLKLLMGDALRLSEAMWRKLTVRYALFFFVVAICNEFVWRTQTDAIWVVWRMPGMPIFAVLFSLTQAPMMVKDAGALEAAALRAAETQE